MWFVEAAAGRDRRQLVPHRVARALTQACPEVATGSRRLTTLRKLDVIHSELEQPGCLHATMDFYKLSPAVPGELVADVFELAVAVRELDMRASPYDLRAFGYQPVEIEVPAGKAQYAEAQRGFAQRGAALRARLIELCRALERCDPPAPRPRAASRPSARGPDLQRRS